jgi:diacylglycerol kinase family enzyme
MGGRHQAPRLGEPVACTLGDVPATVVVLNPQASRMRDAQRQTEIRDQLVRVLRERDGRDPEIVVSTDADATAAAVRRAVADGVDRVVGVGGDGTLTGIATVLAGTSVPLGIVPAGTGNLLAGVLGIPSRLDEAVAALPDAAPRAIDLGEVRIEPADGSPPWSQSFAIGCGIGFDAKVMLRTPPELKRRVGRLAYFAQSAVQALRIGTVPYRVTIDGQLIEMDGSIAMALNVGELVPGLLGPRLKVEPDDGLLEVIVVGAPGPIAGVRGLVDHLIRTEHGHNVARRTLRARGRHVRLESTPPEPLQVDGDAYPPGAVEAEIRPGALMVLAPASAARSR